MNESEENIEIIGDQTSCLNNVQLEEARCFISKTFGNYCGAGADFDEGCKHSINELEVLWKGTYLSKGKKVPIRKKPFLIVNEKLGRGLHRNKNGKFDYCGNVCYFCYACNQKYDRRKGDPDADNASAWESRKSHQVRPLFKNMAKSYLIENTHACKQKIFNQWSGTPELNCSQQTLEKAYKQEFGIAFDEIDTLEYGIKCDYRFCDGIHMIIKGEPPIPSFTIQDRDAVLKEIKDKKKIE